jgi:hypothetical protein
MLSVGEGEPVRVQDFRYLYVLQGEVVLLTEEGNGDNGCVGRFEGEGTAAAEEVAVHAGQLVVLLPHARPVVAAKAGTCTARAILVTPKPGHVQRQYAPPPSGD